MSKRLKKSAIRRQTRLATLDRKRAALSQNERPKRHDRPAAINWIINNQLGRRNLHPDQASYLRGKRYNGEKQDKGGDRKSIDQNDPLIESTADRLATEFKVSAPTIKRDGQYAAAVDSLASVGVDTFQKRPEPAVGRPLKSGNSGFLAKSGTKKPLAQDKPY